MSTTSQITPYYQKIIGLILELSQPDLATAIAGHCMKITGLGINEMDYLWDEIREQYPDIDTYIITDSSDIESLKRISATKLIELRNRQVKPLLVLIPSNSRTAAEDSYGNATFKEISLEGLEMKLRDKLIRGVPDKYKKVVKEDILNYLGQENSTVSDVLNYLIDLHTYGFTDQNIGDFIYQLGLIPDSSLLANEEKIRSRLSFNLQSVQSLGSFNKPLYNRVAELPLVSDSIQQDLVNFLKAESDAKTTSGLCKTIFKHYANLNFAKWEIPDLNFKHITLTCEKISSSTMKVEQGRNVLQAEINKVSKVKVRFQTLPPPKDIKELKYFKIILMAVDGGSGEEISILRKLKNTNTNRTYREALVELNPNVIEEGAYFLKVLAEDQFGNVLNADDDFKDAKVQNAWKEAKKQNPAPPKSDFDYKLTCDSDDFDFVIEEVLERDETQRKNKLDNVLQAYFKFRVDQMRGDEEATSPEPAENSNLWLEDNVRHTSTFYINYSERHNYQISISAKLREIEYEFLENKDRFGHVRVELKNNTFSTEFESLRFETSDITEIIPIKIRELRKEIFSRIQNSNEKKDGIVETADLFNFQSTIKVYLEELTNWTTDIRSKIASGTLSQQLQSKLQHFLTEFQIFDLVRVRTKLPNGQHVEALLLSPLHPLRLSWYVQLWEVFTDWETRTREFPNHKASWANNLETFFEGQVSPENNPLVLVEPSYFKSFHYTGELAYGWGLYLNVFNEESSNGMTSITRQLKHYFRQLFNITKDSYVETDISQKLVIRHLKNYLIQHPYTEKLIINLINAGDAQVFADSLVELEKESAFKTIKYEVRIFKGGDRIIEHGEGLRSLLNPESNVTEQAEAFSQPSQNRLFPKLRFSINTLGDYLQKPSRFTAHISFLVSPFPLRVELVKPYDSNNNFYLNGLLTDSTMLVSDDGVEIKWNRFIVGNELTIRYGGSGDTSIQHFQNLQSFTSGALASKATESIPSTQLTLNDKDKVLLAHLHDNSDWVVTFDKNLGPQIFDQPATHGSTPFLLDYVPGEEVSGISSFLTTKPTSEIIGLLGPHFGDFGLDIHSKEDEQKIHLLLEDLRAISSSLVLQLNSTKNKAFEVIGSAFAKRVLEKKGFLKESFLIPIDLHQNLFEDLPSESKSRADNLLISINPSSRDICVTVIEVKCRMSLGHAEKEELKLKMREQIKNTIEALKMHFDPEFHLSFDRLDREIKNKELKSLLAFYIERAHRYKYLDENAYSTYSLFIQSLDQGFRFKFNQLGLVFDFSTSLRHEKEVVGDELTFFTFGRNLINEILDSESDLNTTRLEEAHLDDELSRAIGKVSFLDPFIQEFKPKMIDNSNSETLGRKVSEALADGPGESVEQIESGLDQADTQTEYSTYVIDKSSQKETTISESPVEHVSPEYDILIGKSSPSEQFGLIGESITNKKIAIDLSETNTISLFGVQGGGKSYTIGTITEMVLKQFSHVNQLPAPLAGVIFHYSESMDYEPEFTSMIYPNDKGSELQKLKERYNVEPDRIEDVILLTPKDKIEERRAEYPSIEVLPIAFNSKELNVQDWMFLLGAVGNDSTYIKQLKAIMKEHRKNLTLDAITNSVDNSLLLSNTQKALARQKLSFAQEYLDDSVYLRYILKPGRLIVVDLRDEFIVKDEALGLFVIMLNIFSAVTNSDGGHFNKFIVFDEAHKYMDNKDLTSNIVTAIREMRHKGVSIMIASQDPPSLPNEIIELSSVVLLHKFNSPQWLKHIQKSITQLGSLTPADMSALTPGEGFLWATKATERSVSVKPIKISTRPRVTKHGGGTVQAMGTS